MRTLTFEQIIDSRFDTGNLEQELSERIEKITSMLRSKDVRVISDGIYKCYFEDNYQYRCRFYVVKFGRRITWDDIYEKVNSVKAVPYKFIDYDWSVVREGYGFA